MKLYTEEQVKKALQEMTTLSQGGIEYYLSDKLTPIELPSDEEIEKESSEWWGPSAFIGGVRWVIGKIKQQGK